MDSDSTTDGTHEVGQVIEFLCVVSCFMGGITAPPLFGCHED